MEQVFDYIPWVDVTKLMELLYQVFDYIPLDHIPWMGVIGFFKIIPYLVLLKLLGPIILSFGKVYDITVINRMTDEYIFSTCYIKVRDKTGIHSFVQTIDPNQTLHYQVVPKWSQTIPVMFGSSTLHIILDKMPPEVRNTINRLTTDGVSLNDISRMINEGDLNRTSIDCSNSIIIPVYNQGDIRGSRVFCIESAGVREFGAKESDIWTWSSHTFAQQGN